MKGTYLASLIITAGLLAFAMVVSGSNFTWYLDFPSLVVMLFPTLVLSMGTHGVKGVLGAFGAAFGDRQRSRQELELALLAARSLGRFAWLSSLIGAFIGAIAILGNIGAMERIGSNVAVALICVFYAALFDFAVVSPMTARIRRKLAQLTDR